MPDDIATIIYTSGTTGSIGHTMKGVSLRLDNINPETGEGEIVAKCHARLLQGSGAHEKSLHRG